VDDAVDDANDVVEGDDNNGRNDAVNEWDDAVEDDKDMEDDDERGHGDELRDGPPKAALTAARKSWRNVSLVLAEAREGPSAGLASVGT
jgi:hypothetical protein